jgi:hypothetical protein
MQDVRPHVAAQQRLPQRRTTLDEHRAAPFQWRQIGELARGWPRSIVRDLIDEETRGGRVERDTDGRVRLKPGAMPAEVVKALQTLTPITVAS